jgi:hypothetical protein
MADPNTHMYIPKEVLAMAGNKTVPLKWGQGGPQVGWATIDENGLVMGEIENPELKRLLFGETADISVYTPNATPGNAVDGG